MLRIRGNWSSPIRLALGLGLAGMLALVLLCREPFMNWLRGPIILGFSGQLTGRYSDLGVQGRNGAALAVEHVNSAGGILGRPLTLLAMDDQNTPEGALAADKALIEAGAVAIIGHMTSSQTMAALPLANATGIVLFSPTTSTPLLSGIKDLFFRNCPTPTSAAKTLAEHSLRASPKPSLAVVLDRRNAEYCEPYAAAFSQRLGELGAGVELTLAPELGDHEEYDAIAASLSERRIEAVLFIASARDTAGLAQHVARIRPPVRLMSSDWASTDTLLRHAGRHAENMVIAVSNPVDTTSPEYTRFAKSFSERFGAQPTFAAARSYEAVLVLAEALRRCGGSAARLPAALTTIRDHPTLSGPLSLDRFGDVESRDMLMRVENSRLVRAD